MANELTINLPAITYIKDPFNENLTPGIMQVTVTGKQITHGSVPIPTAANVVLNKGNIGTIGYVYFKNKDTTLAIQIGGDGTTYPLTLKAGEVALVRWNTASLNAKSASGSPVLEYWAVED
jgi:hypothetical protein